MQLAITCIDFCFVIILAFLISFDGSNITAYETSDTVMACIEVTSMDGGIDNTTIQVLAVEGTATEGTVYIDTLHSI